jgi:hypothetical protein
MAFQIFVKSPPFVRHIVDIILTKASQEVKFDERVFLSQGDYLRHWASC